MIFVHIIPLKKKLYLYDLYSQTLIQ